MPAPALPLALGRFKRLALRSNDAWQGGVFRMPTWVEQGPEGRPYRPWGAVWVSERTGFVHIEPEPAFDSHGPELALVALCELGLRNDKHLGGRAARLRVPDPGLAAHLASQLNDPDTTIEVVDDVPAVREVLRRVAEDFAGGELAQGALEVPGVTVERLRAFADAAAAFYMAAPWQHLQNEDLVVARAPNMPRNLSHLVVMGNAGIHHGLAFFDSRAAFEKMAFGDQDAEQRLPEEAWALYFDPLDELPLGDADAWEQHQLPVAGPEAYPYAIRAGRSGRNRRPAARELASLEALLRALAVTSEDQLDAGEWTVAVTSFDGPVTVTMTLPLLLEAERGRAKRQADRVPDPRVLERASARIGRFLKDKEFGSLEEANEALAAARQAGLFDGDNVGADASTLTPLERAQERVYEAADARGRLRVKRARQALAISPDCADAWVLLAEASPSGERALDLYVKATEAGARALGAEAFETLAGHFWGHIETRPYMRARLGLAQELEGLDRHDAAIDHYNELLRLNPGDNQGVRYLLLALLLRLGRDADVEALLDQYEDDAAAEWFYGRALAMYRRHGDRPPAREALERAVEANPHVVWWLLHREELAGPLPSHVAFGSPEEAASCAVGLFDAWEATPGALSWLSRRAPRGLARGKARSASRHDRRRRR